MLQMYQVVDHEGKFAVKNLSDNLVLKSKESGNVIAFPTLKQAEKLRDFLDNQYNLIAEASKIWWVKEKLSATAFTMRKIEI